MRLRGPFGLSQQRQDPPQLGQALLAALLDTGERVVRRVGRGAQHVAGAAYAEQHDADRVSDDVVQLTGNRRSLLVDGDPRELLALPFGRGRTLLELTHVTAPRLDVGAERPDADAETGGDDRTRRGGSLRPGASTVRADRVAAVAAVAASATSDSRSSQ